MEPTSGTWKVDDRGYVRSVDEEGCETLIAEIMSGDEYEANARLIESAPKMYEYLKIRADRGDTYADAITESIAGDYNQ